MATTMRVAVVGSDVAGLTAARALAKAGAEVVLYEKGNRVGGHAHSIQVSEHDGIDSDVGFMPFNQANFANMLSFFEEAGVEVEGCDMTFGMNLKKGKSIFEWNSNGLAGLFMQKRNFLNPYFWNMIYEILKFNTDISRHLQSMEEKNSTINPNETLGEFLDSYGYSQKFRDDYLIPICASIWSCPSKTVLTLAAVPILTFCRDNQALEGGSSRWLFIKGSHEAYAQKVTEDLKKAGAKIKISTMVTVIKTLEGGRVQLEDDKGGREVFDKCIVAAPASDALQMRGEEATLTERNLLGAFRYADSDVFLHRDAAAMPKRTAAWTAWNFMGDTSGGASVTYWLNRIQNLGHTGLPFLLTVNPKTTPRNVAKHWRTRQLLPTPAATNAAKQMPSIQGPHGVWYCGSYQSFSSDLSGDAIKNGLEIAREVLGRNSFAASGPMKAIVPTWSQFAAKQSVLAVLRKFIRTGTLRLVEAGGPVLEFAGTEKGCDLTCTLQVNNPAFYWKVAAKSDLGLALSYIDGDISFPENGKKYNLCNFIEFVIANLALTKARTQENKVTDKGWWKPLFVTATVGSAVSYFTHILRDNSVTNSCRNISEHYDMSNEMFSLFLDESMTYSCGIFQEPHDTLKDAQLRKLHLLIAKARIKPNHEVLEIGCGWGSMAIELVRLTGCRYTGLTLSVEQMKEAEKRVKAAGLEDRITLLICDYRLLPGQGKFDRIIACEMIEHLGHNYQKIFFDRCDYLLAKDGLVILQASSYPDEGYDNYRRSSGFIKELIFPGGNLPCLSVLATAASSTFTVEHFDNIGPHYVKTLLTWQDNFLSNTSEIRRLGFSDKFIRKMEYYFSYCAAGFKTCSLGCLQVVFSRPGNVATLGDPAVCFPPVLSTGNYQLA